MKRALLIVGASVALLSTGIVVLAAKANFSGAWALDKSRSEGVPPDMEQTMTVQQTDDVLNVETKVVTDQGDQTLNSIYTLNGKETEYAPKRMGTEGKGKRVARWTQDGNGFAVTEEETFETPNGAATLQFTRKWAMAADGKTLTIELDVKGPNGPQHSRRTFIKK
jgi:hypothetical protein